MIKTHGPCAEFPTDKSCELHVDSCGWDPCCGAACKNGSMAGCPKGSCVSELWGNVHFTAKGRRFLAEGVARSISLHLRTNHS
jgi:lysophospholipase L1-like esterase